MILANEKLSKGQKPLKLEHASERDLQCVDVRDWNQYELETSVFGIFIYKRMAKQLHRQ